VPALKSSTFAGRTISHTTKTCKKACLAKRTVDRTLQQNLKTKKMKNNSGLFITSATRQVRQQWFSVGIFPPGPG
jgi:hypothetical protein